MSNRRPPPLPPKGSSIGPVPAASSMAVPTAQHPATAGPTTAAQPLTEGMVEEAFHEILQSALVQAQAEGLIEADAAQQWTPSELKICAASLSLYFAALQAHGIPPSIESPSKRFTLTTETCPESFAAFFALWQVCVPRVQRLNLDQRHDLALILCDQTPQSSVIHLAVTALARDIKVVALDIVQRQTFQSRFQKDVASANAASARASSSSGRYDAPPPTLATASAPNESAVPASARPLPSPPSTAANHKPHGHVKRPSLPQPPLPTIAIEPPPEEDQTILRIRETLFAALGDCLATNERLTQLLHNKNECQNDDDQLAQGWAARAHFASICLAVLDVSLARTTLAEPLVIRIEDEKDPALTATADVHLHAAHPTREQEMAWRQSYVQTVQLGGGSGGRGKEESALTLQACPATHTKLLMGLLNVARYTQSLARADDQLAIDDVQHDRATDERLLCIPALKRILLGEVESSASASLEDGDQTLTLSQAKEALIRETANIINRLALAVFEIDSFRERQAEVFDVLRAITSV